MSVRILIGDVRARLLDLEPESIDVVVTSPPYWGLRDYGVEGQIGMERTLGEHLDTMVEVFRLVRRAMKPQATLWLNYGDCYATSPNGRSAEDTKAHGEDDRTHRDKPFSTIGPIYEQQPESRQAGRRSRRGGIGCNRGSGINGSDLPSGRIVAGGTLKPKDLCMVPNRLAIAMQDDGWWVRSEIVWGKPNPKPDSSGRFRPSSAHEKIWLMSKSAKCYYNAEAVRMPAAEASIIRLAQDIERQKGSDRDPGKTNGPLKAVGRGDTRLLRNYEADLSPLVPPEVWAIPTASFSDAHFATMPPALVVPCLLAGCPEGGTVLDPFGGAGTTGMVADRMGREAVLIELKPEYAELAESRMRNDGGFFTSVQTAV